MRREEGREIRKMFVPSSDENILIDADYSQIELRILAHISGDEAMAEALQKGNMGFFDFYKMKNLEADTNMRNSISVSDFLNKQKSK